MRPLLHPAPPRVRTLALIELRGNWHYEQISKGVFDYCQSSSRLRVSGVFALELGGRSGDRHRSFQSAMERADAVITSLPLERKWNSLREGRLPVIQVSSRVCPDGAPAVLPDNFRIGLSVAEFYLERGFRRFAFLGYRGFHFSDERRRGFEAGLAAEQGVAELHEVEGVWKTATLEAHEEYLLRLRQWLQGLPKPCGLFCANDVIGVTALREALAAGIPVPDELAFTGVDNEPEHRVLSPMALSSVPINSERIGFEAAGLAERMFQGEPAPAAPLCVAPGPIVPRASTDVVLAADPTVRRALGVIYARYREPLRIAEVARTCHVSRRLLELRFRETLHRSPREELERIRLYEARKLLQRGGLNLDEVAEQTGFSHAGLLIARFRSMFGETPGKYRGRVQGESPRLQGAGMAAPP